MNKRIMVIMAHADDMEIYAGGTMAKFTDQGYEGILVMLTANNVGGVVEGKGYRQTTPEEIMPVRAREVRDGAAILGVSVIEEMEFKCNVYSDGEEYVWLGDKEYDMQHPSGSEPLAAAAANPKCVDRVKEMIKKYEPEIVISHNFFTSFPHTAAAHLVNHAFGLAVKEGASLGQLWIPAHVRHLAWQSDARQFPSPNIIIDITDYWDRKQQAMLAHKTQQLEKALDKVKLICRYWGIAGQCELAEPFFTLIDARYR